MKNQISGTIFSTESIAEDLEKLGLRAGMHVIVHSSFKSIGHVIGGPAAVILALEIAITDSGTILMPTFTESLCDPATEENYYPEEYREQVQAHLPVYQADLTPTTRSIGIIPETFRKQNGTLRSSHPHVSFAARGKGAEYLISNHSFHYALGEESPLARLYELKGYILMLGAPLDSITSLHLAEYRLPNERKKPKQWAACILQEGKRVWTHYDDIENECADFPLILQAYMDEKRSYHQGKVGNADCTLVSQPALVDFGVEWMILHRK